MRERGIAGAEIIERHEQSLLAQRFYGARHDLVVAAHEHRFIHLKYHVTEGDIFGGKDILHPFGQVPALEVARGDVDPHMLEGNAGIEPDADVARHLAEHLAGQFIGDARIVQSGLKGAGGNHVAIGQHQPGQCFEANNLGRVEANDGLIVRDQPPLAHCGAEPANRSDPLDHGGAQILAKADIATAIGLLGLIKCKVRILAERLGISAIKAMNRAAKRDMSVNSLVARFDNAGRGGQNARRGRFQARVIGAICDQ